MRMRARQAVVLPAVGAGTHYSVKRDTEAKLAATAGVQSFVSVVSPLPTSIIAQATPEVFWGVTAQNLTPLGVKTFRDCGQEAVHYDHTF